MPSDYFVCVTEGVSIYRVCDGAPAPVVSPTLFGTRSPFISYHSIFAIKKASLVFSKVTPLFKNSGDVLPNCVILGSKRRTFYEFGNPRNLKGFK